MDPELAQRLRRYGQQVDHAAAAAQAARPSVSTGRDDTDALPTIVPIAVARSNRRFQMVTAAAAAAVVVVAGALATWRIIVDDDVAPAGSGPTTAATTASSSPATATTVPVTTMPPAVPLGGSSTTTAATTTTAPSASVRPSPVEDASPSAIGTRPPVCPDYVSYGTSYPIGLCDRGPAVLLIQQRTGAPADGLFGPATAQSVRVFQRLHELNDDGLVGPLTWAAMFPQGAPGTDRDADGTVEPWEVD